MAAGVASAIAIAVAAPCIAQDRSSSPGRRLVTPEVLLAYDSLRAVRYTRDVFELQDLSWLDRDRLLMSLARRPGALGPCSRDPAVPIRDTSSPSPWIIVVDATSGECRAIGVGREPRSSPMGRIIAALPEQAGSSGIEIIVLADDRSVRRYSAPTAGAVGRVRWSPDGTALAYSVVLASIDPAGTRGESPTTRVRPPVTVYGGDDGTAFEPVPKSQVWVATMRHDTLAAPRLLATIDGDIGDQAATDVHWFPGDQMLLASAQCEFDGNYNTALYTIARDGNRVAKIFHDIGAQGLAESIAPSGKRIALLTDPTPSPYPSRNQVITIARDGRDTVLLWTGDVAPKVQSVTWSPDEHALWLAGKAGAFAQLYDMPSHRASTALAARTQQDDGDISDPVLSPDGNRWAWHTSDVYGRQLVRVALRNGGAPRTVINLTPGLDTLALAPVVAVTWRSRDGLEIAGILVKPLHYRPGTRYPLIVDLHGGPAGGVDGRGRMTGIPLEFQMWAAKGYVVFQPDWRASAVYGFAELDRRRAAQDDEARNMDDIMAGVDTLIARGLVDSTRMALIGHSAGAREANWILTHTGRFRVAVSYEGGANAFTYFGFNGRLGHPIAAWRLGGLPWDVPHNWLNASPNMYVKGVTTPTLFISGGQGVGVHDNYYMYAAWRRQHIPAQHAIYWNEGHWVTRPENRRDLVLRVVRWIEKYGGNPRPPGS